VKQHKGCITVLSTPGHGATFTVYLPIHPALDETERYGEPNRPAAGPRAAGGTVLVVDDEPGVRAVIVRTLEENGHRALEASDGGNALEQIGRNGPPDLVLTDLTMPGIGGAELARRLKERWPALPILFMSGYSAEELDRQGVGHHGGDLIEKPFSPGFLAARVAAALAAAD
jgi:two-component system cell cycle sensor histidine kinase/response regulator CckA